MRDEAPVCLRTDTDDNRRGAILDVAAEQLVVNKRKSAGKRRLENGGALVELGEDKALNESREGLG